MAGKVISRHRSGDLRQSWGELFERVAVAALTGRSVTTFSNSTINFYSPQRELRNGVEGPIQVRPDMVGFTFDIEKSSIGTDLRVDANQFLEVKATKALITRNYRKGQIEGMIDVLSEQAKKNENKAAELVIVSTSDLRIGEDIFKYAKDKGVTISGIVAGVDEQGQIYFSDLRTIQSGQKSERAGMIDFVKGIYKFLSGQGTFENKPGFDLKDFTNGISNKGNEPIKIDVPNPRSGVNDPDPPEIDDK